MSMVKFYLLIGKTMLIPPNKYTKNIGIPSPNMTRGLDEVMSESPNVPVTVG